MITVNGVRTHYERMAPKADPTGREPVLVCVHGLGYDSLASFYLTVAAPLAAAGVDVLTYDLRAHGRTERPTTGYLVSDFVEDLRVLLDQLGVDRPVHLMGNSFGGTIAFSYAARFPERVHSVIAIEAEPATDGWADRMGRTLSNVIDEMHKEENLLWVEQTFGAHHARLARAAGALIMATSIVQDVPRGPLLDGVGLASIRCPVLSIVGSEGFQREDLTGLEGLLPDCRTEIMRGTGHSVLVERHRDVRELVLDWVRQHDPVGVA
ncbi:alpha/beta hydrolase [Kutzneria viridogrisea]|nr:alpha/beta hydrolase [Kutzneria albida]MBA8924857.1 pimeloyl-ACP methyl ester carboxylesterase [Kutzneria viridogrisea]